jgi:hypothetical protein
LNADARIYADFYWVAFHNLLASFDELAYDYTQTIITLQMADLSPRTVLHEKTDHFLYLLRELRDVFQQCSFCMLLILCMI